MLPLVWVAMLIVFSIPSGKRDVYLIWRLPMVSLGIWTVPATSSFRLARRAWVHSHWRCSPDSRWLASAPGRCSQPFSSSRPTSSTGMTRELVGSTWVMVRLLGSSMLLSALIFRPRRGVESLLGAAGGHVDDLGLSLFSDVERLNSPAALCRAPGIADHGGKIGFVAWKEQNVLMANGPVHDFSFSGPGTNDISKPCWLTSQAWQTF